MRITNVECRIMKFNKVFHYFDIRYSLFDLPAMPLGRLEIAPQCSRSHAPAWECIPQGFPRRSMGTR